MANVNELQHLVGKTEADAGNELAARGLTLRVWRRDGRSPRGCGSDCNPARVNVSVRDGIIDRVMSLG